MQVDSGEHNLMSRTELLNKLATLTGGRSAEELVFGADNMTTGASNDIEQATKLARAMITRYGMTEAFDMVALETVNNQYLGGDTSLACSADTAAEIDRQVVATVKAAHQKALALLRENEDKLHALAGRRRTHTPPRPARAGRGGVPVSQWRVRALHSFF